MTTHRDYGGDVHFLAAQFAPIGVLAARLARAIERWVAQYPETLDRDYAVHVGLTHAFQAPWLNAEEHMPACKAAMWIFGADDIVDKGTMSSAVAKDILRHYVDVANGATPSPADMLGVQLAEIRSHLADRPLFEHMGQLWLDSFSGLLDGFLFELMHGSSIRAGGEPPELDEYLRHYQSVGADFVNWTLWISTGDASLLPHLEQLTEAIQEATLMIRFLNDLHGYSREMTEPAPLNMLMLGATPAWVDEQISLHLARCGEILEPLVEKGIDAAVTTARLANWIVHFYQAGDYRPESA